MRRPGLLALAFLPACLFDPSGLPPAEGDGPSGEIDAPASVDAPSAIDGSRTDAREIDAPPPDARPIDAPVIDAPPPDAAPIDARPPDAAPPDAAPPDAEPLSPCDLAATGLSLDLAWTTGTTVSAGAGTYTASCSTSSGPEVVYRVDVPHGTARDLVVEWEATSGLDAVIDVTTECRVATSSVACADASGSPNRDEVAVVVNPLPGRHYAVVDAWGSTSGTYRVRAWLRPHRLLGHPCDPDVIVDRCVEGVCMGSVCTAATTDLDESGNAEACSTPDGPFGGDFVFMGNIFESGSGIDVDVVEIGLSSPATMHAVVVSAVGGCDVDVEMALEGGSCWSPTGLASDDDSGLGACPSLTAALSAGTYWLDLRRYASFGVGDYWLIVDFTP